MTSENKARIQIYPDAVALCRAAAEAFTKCADEAISAKGEFTVLLSGGSTPKGMFNLLASETAFKDSIAWEHIQFFWGDERHVPPEHGDSNYKMTLENLLSKVPVAKENVHRIMSEGTDATIVATKYEEELKQYMKPFSDGFPRFDLAFLGMGPDGHCASLFPGTKALAEKEKWVVANWVGKFNTWRITLTAPAINHSARIIFLVGGDDKAQPLKSVLEGPYEPEQLPSQLIDPVNGELVWYVDKKAATLLTL